MWNKMDNNERSSLPRIARRKDLLNMDKPEEKQMRKSSNNTRLQDLVICASKLILLCPDIVFHDSCGIRKLGQYSTQMSDLSWKFARHLLFSTDFRFCFFAPFLENVQIRSIFYIKEEFFFALWWSILLHHIILVLFHYIIMDPNHIIPHCIKLL